MAEKRILISGKGTKKSLREFFARLLGKRVVAPSPAGQPKSSVGPGVRMFSRLGYDYALHAQDTPDPLGDRRHVIFVWKQGGRS